MPGQRLRPRRPVEGCLLATGSLVPRTLSYGESVEVVVTVTTSDHVRHSHPMTMFVERRGARAKARPKTDLYDRPYTAEARINKGSAGDFDREDSDGNSQNSLSQGNPQYTWNGGGTNQIAYDHCLADGLLKKYQGNPSGEPLQVLSMRTLQY